MKKLKYAIIILSVLSIILLIILINILKQSKEIVEVRDIPNESKLELEKETNRASVIKANELIKNFFAYIKEENNNIQNNIAAYSVLDKEYKEKNGITEENVIEKHSNYKNIVSYSTKNIYAEKYLEGEGYVTIFLYVEGKIRKETGTEKVYVLIKEDLVNYTYSIQFMTEEKFKDIISKGSIEKTVIEDAIYNKMYIKTVSDYNACVEHMKDYINILKSDIEEAYDLLGKEYREKRFGSLVEFKNYLNNNKNIVNRTGFTEYAAREVGEYMQYICKDNYGYIYVFTEKYPMQYTVELDTYTIETKEYIEKYTKAPEDEKVQVNIQKFILMINNQDYRNAYSKLDDTYKQTYFKTQKDFENYVKENMFKYNKISILSGEKTSDQYIFTIQLTDLTNGIYKEDKEKKESYQYRIVMKLLENRDFVMSFGV